ncbi:MAG: mechanosensitive ion channel [Ilumatobacteraceae bacterium]|nr:mechanosensitive ion channel [Ilumatobacteraceae bacterium]
MRHTAPIIRHTEEVNIAGLLSPLVVLAAEEEISGIQRFLTRPVIAIVIVIGCFILTRITYAILRIVVRKVADSKPGRDKGWWKNTMRRVGAETLEGGENRRRQRIEAATGMLHQLTSFVLWIIAIIAVFNVLDLDATFFLSSAGFLGAAIAIGGQHRVGDYLTGLAVLLEDRFGVGDEIEASLGWDKPVRATVEHVGMITTRLRDGNSTFHIPHSKLEVVRNLSQEPVRESLQFDVASSDAARVSTTVRNLAGTKGLTTVLFIDEIQAAGTEGDRVELNVRTTRPLTENERELLVQKASEVLARDT